MIRQAIGFILLLLAATCAFIGAVSFKNFYRGDFSIFDFPNFVNINELVVGVICVTLSIFLSVHAAQKLRGS